MAHRLALAILSLWQAVLSLASCLSGPVTLVTAVANGFDLDSGLVFGFPSTRWVPGQNEIHSPAAWIDCFRINITNIWKINSVNTIIAVSVLRFSSICICQVLFLLNINDLCQRRWLIIQILVKSNNKNHFENN